MSETAKNVGNVKRISCTVPNGDGDGAARGLASDRDWLCRGRAIRTRCKAPLPQYAVSIATIDFFCGR